MAAVTTDNRARRPTAGRARHLALVPSRPSGSARVVPDVYGKRRAMAVLVAVGLALVAWVGLTALGGSPGVAGQPASASASASASKTAPVTVEVAPGDTFWSIASRLQAGGDPRPLVDRLVASHRGGVLRAGEHLVVNQS